MIEYYFFKKILVKHLYGVYNTVNLYDVHNTDWRWKYEFY